VYSSALSGTQAHGVIFTGGSYTEESGFNPVIAVPDSTPTDGVGDEGPLPWGTVFVPGVRVSFGVAGGSVGKRGVGEVGYTNMVVHTGYCEDYSGETCTETTFGEMQFTVYYAVSGDVESPDVTDPGAGGFHTLDGLTADFAATVTDNTGVYRVLVTYNDRRTDTWKSLDLENTSGDLWRGTLILKGDITYYVQAVDVKGNVGMVSVTGSDTDGNGTPYGSLWSGPKTWEIVVPDGDGDGLPDAYEDQYACLDSTTNNTTGYDPGLLDGADDHDYDLLTNEEEFSLDLNPCDGDTDGGGDNDGSELHHGRDPYRGGDDLHITAQWVKGNLGGDPGIEDVEITWLDGEGNNAAIDGMYFVYRSETPFFDPGDLLTGPLDDGVDMYQDFDPPCSVCYYNVWNYTVDTWAPIVDSVAPNHVAAGTTVSVYGDYFAEGATVEFGEGTFATGVVFINTTKLKCVVPAGAGTVDIIVTNPNGQYGTLPGGFSYP